MRKQINLILLIAIFLVIELITIGIYINSRKEVEAKQKEIEKLSLEIAKYRRKFSTNHEDILVCIREAYYNRDVNETIRLYKLLKSAPVQMVSNELYQIYDFIKALNRMVENKDLKGIVAEIEKDEAESKALQKQLSYVFSQIAPYLGRESELKKKYGEKNFQLAKSGSLETGWGEDLCEFAWGKPYKKSTYASKVGITESWYYNKNGSFFCLFFNNGVLESVYKSETTEKKYE